MQFLFLKSTQVKRFYIFIYNGYTGDLNGDRICKCSEGILKCEKEDEHRLRVIGMSVRKLLERELIEINAKLEKYKNSEARFSSRYNMDFTEFEKRFTEGKFPEDSDRDYVEWYAVHDAYKHWKKKQDILEGVLLR